MNLKQALNIKKPSLFGKEEIKIGQYSTLDTTEETEQSFHEVKFIIGGSGTEIIEVKGDIIKMKFYITNVTKEFEPIFGEEIMILNVEDYDNGKKTGIIKVTPFMIVFRLEYLNTPIFSLI